MQSILSATTSLSTRKLLQFSPHSHLLECILNWISVDCCWNAHVITIKRQPNGISSASTRLTVLYSILLLPLHYYLYHHRLRWNAERFQAIRMLLTECHWSSTVSGVEKTGIMIFRLLAPCCLCSPALGAPLTAAARDSRPKWRTHWRLCPCDCNDRCCVHNLWLWLLKARMMSTSVEINKNYGRTQFALRTDISGRRMWNTHQLTHAYSAADGRFEWKIHYSYQRRAIRENYGQNEFQFIRMLDWLGLGWCTSQLCGLGSHTQTINIHQRQSQRHSTLRDIVIYKWAKC